jgi:hypothetical protein
LTNIYKKNQDMRKCPIRKRPIIANLLEQNSNTPALKTKKEFSNCSIQLQQIAKR